MSERQADKFQGAVAGSNGIDCAENNAAVADVLRGTQAMAADAPASNRPHVDPVTGEVSGTGSGTGGGNPGEDQDDDHTAGSNTLK